MLSILFCVALVAPTFAPESLPARLARAGHETAQLPTPEELVVAWRALSDADRADTIEWFVAECDGSKNFRTTLEQFVLARHRGRRFDWPEAAPELPVYDTAVHTPAQLIPRKYVKEGTPLYERTHAALVGARKERAVQPAFRYDWSRGTVVKLGAWDEPERLAHNAAQGFSPYADLVEALVEMELDGDALRAEAAAFGHAYADRSGRAYRTISLYDAWSSGAEIEMPDVECLGILHDLEDDWKSFVAPVPEAQHEPLYDRIGGHYARLRKHRALRTAIARTFLQAAPRLPSGYESGVLRLHGFWEIQSSDPAKMAKDLPTVKGWTDWFVERGAQADETPEIVEGARARVAGLKESRAWTRRTFYGILKEYGAFDVKAASDAGSSGNGAGGR